MFGLRRAQVPGPARAITPPDRPAIELSRWPAPAFVGPGRPAWRGRNLIRAALLHLHDGAPLEPALDGWASQLTDPAPAAFEHPTDVAHRLVSWAVAALLLGDDLPPDLARLVAGGVRDRHAFLLRARRRAPEPLRPLQDAGRLVAALVWGLDWANDLVDLRGSLGRAVAADGTSEHPDVVQRAVEATLLARRLAGASRVPWPRDLDAAVTRAATALGVLDEGGPRPPIGAFSAETLFGPGCAWDGAAAAGLVSADAVGPTRSPFGPARAPAVSIGKDWSVRAFRAGNWAVAHSTRKGAPSRAVLAGLVASWCVRDVELLLPAAPSVGSWGPGATQVARVDGRRATLVAQGGAWTRRMELEADRLILEDRYTRPVSWRLGLGGTLVPDDRGWTLDCGQVRATVRVDAGPSWRTQGNTLLAEGDRMRVRIELR